MIKEYKSRISDKLKVTEFKGDEDKLNKILKKDWNELFSENSFIF